MIVLKPQKLELIRKELDSSHELNNDYLLHLNRIGGWLPYTLSLQLKKMLYYGPRKSGVARMAQWLGLRR